MTKEQSPAIRALGALWDALPGGSWTRLNGAMSSGLMCIIKGGVRFDEDDFAIIAKRFRWGYWCDADGGERFYSAACGRPPNKSAAIAFEKYRGRTAYIWEGRRLAVGHCLIWKGYDASVTSIGPEGLIAVVRGLEGESKIKKRFTITRAKLKEAEREEKARKAAWREAADEALVRRSS